MQSDVRRALLSRRRELRTNATEAERILWPLLKNLREKGLIFRRQHSIGPYIVDFCCPAKWLVIEIDGSVHDDESQKEYDDERTKYLNVRGFRVIRFKNDEVLQNPLHTIQSILDN